jgi:hypothetical protein
MRNARRSGARPAAASTGSLLAALAATLVLAAPARAVTMGTGPTTTTTTTTAPGSSTTSTTTVGGATTTTTLVPGAEVCGNCLDDDGNGLVDFEDPACCDSTALGFNVKRARIKGWLTCPGAGATTSALGLKARVGGLGTVTPATHDLFLQVRDPAAASGEQELLCVEIDAERFARKHKRYRFKSATPPASMHGVTKAVVKMRKGGGAALNVSGKRTELLAPGAGALEVTLGFRDPAAASGNRCGTKTVVFRAKRKCVLRFP